MISPLVEGKLSIVGKWMPSYHTSKWTPGQVRVSSASLPCIFNLHSFFLLPRLDYLPRVMLSIINLKVLGTISGHVCDAEVPTPLKNGCLGLDVHLFNSPASVPILPWIPRNLNSLSQTRRKLHPKFSTFSWFCFVSFAFLFLVDLN